MSTPSSAARRTTKADRARAKRSLTIERRCGQRSGEGIASRARTLRSRREGRQLDLEVITETAAEVARALSDGLGPALARLGYHAASAGENLAIAWDATPIGE